MSNESENDNGFEGLDSLFGGTPPKKKEEKPIKRVRESLLTSYQSCIKSDLEKQNPPSSDLIYEPGNYDGLTHGVTYRADAEGLCTNCGHYDLHETKDCPEPKRAGLFIETNGRTCLYCRNFDRDGVEECPSCKIRACSECRITDGAYHFAPAVYGMCYECATPC